MNWEPLFNADEVREVRDLHAGYYEAGLFYARHLARYYATGNADADTLDLLRFDVLILDDAYVASRTEHIGTHAARSAYERIRAAYRATFGQRAPFGYAHADRPATTPQVEALLYALERHDNRAWDRALDAVTAPPTPRDPRYVVSR